MTSDDFWATVCKQIALFYRTVVCPAACPVYHVCDVGDMRPNV